MTDLAIGQLDMTSNGESGLTVFRGTFVHTPAYGQLDMLCDRLMVLKDVSNPR